MVANRFFTIIAIITLISGAITVLLGWFFRSRRIVKYIPMAIAGVAAVASLIKALFFSQGFGGIGYMILAMISGVVFLVSLITAVIMEIVMRRKEC